MDRLSASVIIGIVLIVNIGKAFVLRGEASQELIDHRISEADANLHLRIPATEVFDELDENVSVSCAK